jgi:hypothetical protein
MTDHVIRDPMTLDEERRAALTLSDESRHLNFIRDLNPAMVTAHLNRREVATPYTGNELLSRYAGAILSGDCDNER